jgi:hypothetical protein
MQADRRKKPSTTGAEARNTAVALDPVGTVLVPMGTEAGGPSAVVPLPPVRAAEIEPDPFGLMPATLAASPNSPSGPLFDPAPDLATAHGPAGAVGTLAVAHGSQHRTSWVQQQVPGALLEDPSPGEDASSRAGSRSSGLLPGVDTSAEGFETSLLPTVGPPVQRPLLTVLCLFFLIPGSGKCVVLILLIGQWQMCCAYSYNRAVANVLCLFF